MTDIAKRDIGTGRSSDSCPNASLRSCAPELILGVNLGDKCLYFVSFSALEIVCQDLTPNAPRIRASLLCPIKVTSEISHQHSKPRMVAVRRQEKQSKAGIAVSIDTNSHYGATGPMR
jgi:hypothetical protein